jgi:hypothetical protein
MFDPRERTKQTPDGVFDVRLPPNPHLSTCASFDAKETRQAIPAVMLKLLEFNKEAGRMFCYLWLRPARDIACGKQSAHKGVSALSETTGRAAFNAVTAH